MAGPSPFPKVEHVVGTRPRFTNPGGGASRWRGGVLGRQGGRAGCLTGDGVCGASPTSDSRFHIGRRKALVMIVHSQNNKVNFPNVGRGKGAGARTAARRQAARRAGEAGWDPGDAPWGRSMVPNGGGEIAVRVRSEERINTTTVYSSQ